METKVLTSDVKNENEEESILIENGTTIMEDEILIIEDSSSDEDYVENENCFVEFEDYNACEDPLDCNSSQEHSKTFNDLHEDTNSLLSRISDSSETKLSESETGLDHKKSRRFKCKECAKTFETKPYLNQHMWSHKHADQRYECSICHKLNKNSSCLNLHMKSHTKPYKCDACGVGFSRKDRRDEHVKYRCRDKSKPAVYICECGMRYQSLVFLRNHQVSDHDKYRKRKSKKMNF